MVEIGSANINKADRDALDLRKDINKWSGKTPEEKAEEAESLKNRVDKLNQEFLNIANGFYKALGKKPQKLYQKPKSHYRIPDISVVRDPLKEKSLHDNPYDDSNH